MKIKNLILGAGIAGISAASHLNKDDTLIIEKENYYGGLCNSFNIEGFTFDTAVHLSFTNEASVRDIFDKTKYNIHLPIAYNYFHGKWLKHPIENNLYPLTTSEKVNCIKSFIERPKFEKINNYEEWLLSNYGEIIYNKFYKEYTYKYWCSPPNKLSTSWINKRFSITNIDKILYGALSENTNIDYYAKEMRYPVYGGYKSFLTPLLKNINLKLENEVIKIKPKENKVLCKNNIEYEYENLISSIPLPKIINLIDDVPNNVIDASNKLVYTSVILVSVGFNKPDISPYLWFYIYDKSILPSRAYSPSKKSNYNAPPNCSSIQFEIYFTKDKPINKSKDEIIEHIKLILIKLNLCNEEDILFIDYRVIPYANIVFYNGMEENRQIVKNFLTDNKINSIGRFGEWDYLWSDQSYISGKNITQHLN